MQIPREKSLVRTMNRSTVSSCSNAFDDHDLLGVDHEQAPQAQAPSLDACLSSAMSPHGGGVTTRISGP